MTYLLDRLFQKTKMNPLQRFDDGQTEHSKNPERTFKLQYLETTKQAPQP